METAVSKAIFGFMLLLTICLSAMLPNEAKGATLSPKRLFYVASSGTPVTPGILTSIPPSGNCSGCIANLTITPISFIMAPSLQSPLTINGPVILLFWINGSFKPSDQISIRGAFSYNLPGQPGWLNPSNYSQRVFPGLTNVNITLPISAIGLLQTSTIAIEISVTPLPQNSTVALDWGSSSARSLVIVPMSDYESLFPANTITIQDRSDNPVSYFYLNVLPPNNLVVVKVFVQAALGITDILKVNMTIEDPGFRPAAGATNETMRLASGTSPYQYIASWPYPNNSTQGTYQVLIDIVDVQGNIAYSSAPATFGLVPPGYIPFPYNLIPYFIVGGVGAAGGIGGGVFYRRRKRKSYLVPFDHFNTITGGGLDGGTVVSVEGNTGSGKTLLLEQLMGDDLRNGRPCVFVTTGDFPNNIRASMKAMGVDISGYEQNGLLTFVDGYSAEAGQMSQEKVSIPSLGDLTTLGIKITSALPSPSFKGGSLYFDSLTPLSSKAKADSIVSFVQSVGAKVRGLSGKAFFTVGLGIDGSVQRQLEETADCIVQMEAFEESGARKRRLRIMKLRARKHQEGWSLFTIEDGKGIIFYSKKPKR